MKTRLSLLACAVFLLLLSSCSPLIKIEQADRQSQAQLAGGSRLGQTFVARYRGLEGIAVYLTPQPGASGRLVLHLRSGPQATQDIAQVELPLASVDTPGYYRFSFSPLSGSTNQDYYFDLQLEGRGDLLVSSAAGGTYLNGASYRNGQAQDSQLAFRLVYAPQAVALGLVGEVGKWLLLFLTGLWLFVLPGWGLTAWCLPDSRQWPWEARLGFSAGLSLAIYPLLFLWASLVGLRLGAFYAWLPPLIGLAALAWSSRGTVRASLASAERMHIAFPLRLPQLDWADFALVGLMALIFGVRFWAIRSLDLPLWGDSYQHSLIAQLLVEHGGLFRSWQPYTDLQTFTYHFGFHSLVAVFHWLSRMSVLQSVLWVGQILNGLAVISLLPLAHRLTPNRWAGVVVLLVAGLLAPMPMFYLNWGRYTQLAGQVILPAAVLLAWDWLQGRSRGGLGLGLTWFALAGLALTHYRVLLFAVIFLAALALLYSRQVGLGRFILRGIWLFIGAALLFLPWFINVFGGKILKIFAFQLATPPSQLPALVNGPYLPIGNLFDYLPPLLWIMLPLAAGWALWRRERAPSLIALWWFLVFLAANPQWLSLPGVGALDNFTVLIAAYIPASLLLGSAAAWLIEKLPGWFPAPSVESLHAPRPALASLLLLALALGAGFWGARQRMGDPRPAQFALATRPDLRAAAWIQEHTPPEAHFLVNSFFAFSGQAVVGSDGGWWLPLLAHRAVSVPPLNYTFEADPWPGYRQWVNALTAQIAKQGIDQPDTLKLLQERGIQYVYIGQQQGRVNYSGPQVLSPEQLAASPHFETLYHQDRVWIFAIHP